MRLARETRRVRESREILRPARHALTIRPETKQKKNLRRRGRCSELGRKSEELRARLICRPRALGLRVLSTFRGGDACRLTRRRRGSQMTMGARGPEERRARRVRTIYTRKQKDFGVFGDYSYGVSRDERDNRGRSAVECA